MAERQESADCKKKRFSKKIKVLVLMVDESRLREFKRVAKGVMNVLARKHVQ